MTDPIYQQSSHCQENLPPLPTHIEEATDPHNQVL